MKKFNHLVLVRHGQSEWNAKNLFTGWRDPDLTQLGIDEAEKGGELLIEKQISFDVLYICPNKINQHCANYFKENWTRTNSNF